MEKMNMDRFQENIVPAENQNSGCYFEVKDGDGLRVLFVGNSITKHGIKPDIGWNRDCGMAASSVEKDYVHILSARIAREQPDAAIRILQVGEYERNFSHVEASAVYADAARFQPDIVVMFFGANVDRAYDEEKSPVKTFGKAVEELRMALDTGHTRFVIAQGFYIRPVLDAEKEAVAAKYGDTFVRLEDIRSRADTHGDFNHPNDVGMLAIADRFWSVIEPLVTKA